MATDCFLLCVHVQRSSSHDSFRRDTRRDPVAAAGDNLLRVTTRRKATGTALASAGRHEEFPDLIAAITLGLHRSRCGSGRRIFTAHV